MADPTKYEPGYSFTDFQASNPATPLPADEVDTELANIALASDRAVDAIKDIRRSDGKLKNGIVTPDSLSPGLKAGWDFTDEQLTAIEVVGDNITVVTVVADNIDELTPIAENIDQVLQAQADAASALASKDDAAASAAAAASSAGDASDSADAAEAAKDAAEAIAENWSDQVTNRANYVTWTELDAVTGSAGDGADVIGPDEGTHTDPVVGGSVPNLGVYVWSVSPAGWRRTGYGIANKLDFQTEEIEGYVAQFTDPDDKILWAVNDDGEFEAKLAIDVEVSNGVSVSFDPGTGRVTLKNGDTEGILAFGDTEIDTTFVCEGVVWQVLGPGDELVFAIYDDGTTTGDPANLAATIAEIEEARGNAASLADRLDMDTDADGMVSDGHIFGSKYLRWWRNYSRGLLDSENLQLEMALFADSLGWERDKYSTRLATSLQAMFGDGGHGWTGFGYHTANDCNGNAVPSRVSVERSGSGWTGGYYTIDGSPDLGAAISSTAGDKLTVTRTHTGNVSGADLHYIGGAGQVRYRWDGGSWTTLSLTGSGGQAVALSSVPTGDWTLEIEIVSGTCTLCGVNLKSTSPGVIFHNLAATGSTMSGWSGHTGSLLTALPRISTSIRLFWIALMTNDQGSGTDYGVFAAAQLNFINMLRAAFPNPDIICVIPAENARGLPKLLPLYGRETKLLGRAQKFTVLDEQPLFGENVTDYNFASAPSLLRSDTLHRTAAGGRVEHAAKFRLLVNSP